VKIENELTHEDVQTTSPLRALLFTQPLTGRNLLLAKDFALSELEGDRRNSLRWALPNAIDLRLSAVSVSRKIMPRIV
jgi:hypothetical protein